MEKENNKLKTKVPTENSTDVELIEKLEQPEAAPVTETAPAEKADKPAPKKSKRPLVVALICLAVAAVIALIWFLIMESPEGVFRTAVSNFNKAETVKIQSVTDFQFKNPEQRGAETGKVTLTLSDTKLPMDATLDVKIMTPKKEEMSASLQLKIVSSTQFFVKTDNLEKYLQDMGFAEVLKQTMGEEFYNALAANLDEGWWEVNTEGLNTLSKMFGDAMASTSLGQAFTCLGNSSKITLENATFLSATPVENKTRTYKILVDSNELAAALKQPVNCFVEVDQNQLAENLAGFVGELPTIYLEVNEQKQFSRLYTTSETEIYSRKTEFLFSYPKTNDFKMPESYGSVETLLIRYGFNLLEKAVN